MEILKEIVKGEYKLNEANGSAFLKSWNMDAQTSNWAYVVDGIELNTNTSTLNIDVAPLCVPDSISRCDSFDKEKSELLFEIDAIVRNLELKGYKPSVRHTSYGHGDPVKIWTDKLQSSAPIDLGLNESKDTWTTKLELTVPMGKTAEQVDKDLAWIFNNLQALGKAEHANHREQIIKNIPQVGTKRERDAARAIATELVASGNYDTINPYDQTQMTEFAALVGKVQQAAAQALKR